MNLTRGWIVSIYLFIFIIILSIILGVVIDDSRILRAERKDIYTVELENGLKDIKIKELSVPTTTTKIPEATTTTVPVNIDFETFEYVVSFSFAQKSYIALLQELLRKHDITYPNFMYLELTEEE